MSKQSAGRPRPNRHVARAARAAVLWPEKELVTEERQTSLRPARIARLGSVARHGSVFGIAGWNAGDP